VSDSTDNSTPNQGLVFWNTSTGCMCQV